MVTFLPVGAAHQLKLPAAALALSNLARGTPGTASYSLSLVNFVTLVELLRVDYAEAERMRSLANVPAVSFRKRVMRELETLLFPLYPFVRYYLSGSGFTHKRGINYDPEHPACVLDAVCDESSIALNSKPKVFLYVHGGGWVVGSRTWQSVPLVLALARKGFVVCTIDYRLAPTFNMREQICDAKSAIDFVKFGGLKWSKICDKFRDSDVPSFVGMGGESAGGHISSLCAVTQNRFATYKQRASGRRSDTSLDAVIDLYGLHDIEDVDRHFRDLEIIQSTSGFKSFLALVVAESRSKYPELSPMHQIKNYPAHAPRIPPMMTAHGGFDSLVPIEDGRAFYSELAARRAERREMASDLFCELGNAPHAFNMMSCPLTFALSDVAATFLDGIVRGGATSRM